MREFLEDAEKNITAGLGRAGMVEKRPLAKRFYKTVSVASTPDGFAIHLDKRPVKTPGMKIVLVPNQALAETLATEWQAQEHVIDPIRMPTTRLVNSSIEAGANTGALRAELLKYAASDLLYYRAETPASLVEAQNAGWDPVLVALARHHNVLFRPTTGVIHQPQPDETLRTLGARTATLGHFSMTALVSMTGLTGSACLALALLDKLIDPEVVWAAAHVDEQFNETQWGADAEAIKRRNYRKAEFDAAVTVLRQAEPL